MATDPKVGLLWAALATSVGVHAASALGLAALPPASLPSMFDAPAEIEITVVDPVPEDLPRALEERAVVSVPVRETPPLAVEARPIVPPTPAPALPDPIVEVEIAPPAPEAPRPEERERRPRVSLDPRSVAQASFEIDHARGTRDVGPSERDVLRHELDSALGRAANARPYVSERPPPELRSMSDGTFVFDGPTFDAVIERDGTVQFSDRPSVGIDAPAISSPRGLGGTFDLNDAAQRAAGNDPHAAERAWFLRETARLRDGLGDRARTRDTRRGTRMVREQFDRIWAGRGSDAERRRRIFALWDECAEDEMGRPARAAIVELVRERLPRGSVHAFTAPELARLNADRESRAAFSPY